MNTPESITSYYKYSLLSKTSRLVRAMLVMLLASLLGLFGLAYHLATPAQAESPADSASQEDATTDANGAADSQQAGQNEERTVLDADDRAAINPVCKGVALEGLDSDKGCDTNGATDKITATVQKFIDVFMYTVGITSLIMLIYGGFRYVVSQGSEAGVKAARNTVIYSIIGLLIAILAPIILNAVIGQLQ